MNFKKILLPGITFLSFFCSRTFSMEEEKPIWDILAQQDAKGSDEKYKKLKTKYETFEKKFQATRIKLTNICKNDPSNPLANPLCGGINFFMSPDEIKKTLETKIISKIIPKKTFEKNQDKYYGAAEYIAGKPLEKPSCNNLTRLWGVEYLGEQIRKNRGILNFAYPVAVPQLVVVIEDPNNVIVTMDCSNLGIFPCADKINGASIFGTKIIGDNIKEIEREKGFSYVEHLKKATVSKLNFLDFADPGNIIRTKKGMIYIVDTDKDGFSRILHRGEGAIPLAQNKPFYRYVRKRFLLLYKNKIGRHNKMQFKLDIPNRKR